MLMQSLLTNRLAYDAVIQKQALEIYFCTSEILYSTHAPLLDRAF